MRRGISETRKIQAEGAELFRWSTLMLWLGDLEVVDEIVVDSFVTKKNHSRKDSPSVLPSAIQLPLHRGALPLCKSLFFFTIRERISLKRHEKSTLLQEGALVGLFTL